MSDEKNTARAEARSLFWIGDGRLVGHDSSWWPQIAGWQRRGLVALRWGESGLSCTVLLTEKGVEYVNEQHAS